MPEYRSVMTLIILLAGFFLGLMPLQFIAAQEDPLEMRFLQGLRERGYHDYAMIYLTQLESKPTTPPEIKAIIPLEKALTLMESAANIKNPDAQYQQYDQAVGLLEEFIKKNPGHPRAASANTDRARILIGKSKVKVWQSNAPANAGVKQKFQQEARDLITQARTMYENAKNIYEAEWKKFPSSISPDDKAQLEAREKAEGLYMRSQLDVVDTIYQEAQTFDPGSKQKIDLLIKASEQYENIHSRYRSHISGLFARLMEGKCFEEQDDIRRALGIYQELLSHDAQDTRLNKMQDQAFYFKLICYNHPSRHDHALVIQEAENWLTLNKGRARTETGLGIRWELTRAQEALANDRTTSPEDKDKNLRQALANAGEIHRFPGPYQDVAFSTIQRLRVALNREPGDPTDFESAFGLANKMIEEIGTYKDKIAQANSKNQPKDAQEQSKALAAHLVEAERIWRLALQLVTPSIDSQQVNTARYRLAYVLYLQQKNFEAAVIGEFLAIHYRTSQPTTALDAAYLAMAAIAQARSQVPIDQREEMIPLVVARCQYIVDNWSDTDRAQDARITMGRLLNSAKKELEASKWFQQVPATSDQYSSAQLEAGQSLWLYVQKGFSTPETVDPKSLDPIIAEARKALETGLNLKLKTLAEKAPTPDEVVLAKVSLANIMIRQGQDQQAIDLLSKAPHAVTEFIKVPDETKRSTSKTDLKGRTFASYVWQLILRANVGAKKLNEARQAREQLEKIAGAEDSAALTAVYVELGRELQNELTSLNQSGNTKRLTEVKTAFEAFLKDLSDRTEGQNYGSLIWIAETYFSLGKGSDKDPNEARKYYDQASKMYRQILAKAQSDPKFLEPGKVPGVKIRLVTCQQIAGNFAEAETLVNEVLKENPKALEAQIEAAKLYQNWGEKEPTKYSIAVNGNPSTGFWGWGQIATRLQILTQQGGDKKAEFEEKLFESRYNTSLCRNKYADSLSGDLAKQEREKAEFELVAFTRVMPSLVESDYWNKYDNLYQDLLKKQNKIVGALKKPSVVASTPKPKPVPKAVTKTTSTQVAQSTTAPKAEEKSSNSLTYIVAGIVCVLGLGMIGFVVATGGGKKKTSSPTSTASVAPAPAKTANPVKPAAAAGTPPKPQVKTRPVKPVAPDASEEMPAPPVRKKRPPQAGPASEA